MFDTLARYQPAAGRLVLPDVCCDVTFAGNQVNVSGPLTHARESLAIGQDVVLLRIAPAAAYGLLRVPISALTNYVVPLDQVHRDLGRELERAHERGQLAGLVARPTPAVEGDPRFDAAAAALGRGFPVRRVASMVGLSERQLERLFNLRAGLAPKAFARILRVRRALISARRGGSLAAAAAAHGFADQAHFNRDVRSLTGRAPGSVVPNVGSVQDIIAGTI
jgi:AraC-like DNA-binding protein